MLFITFQKSPTHIRYCIYPLNRNLLLSRAGTGTAAVKPELDGFGASQTFFLLCPPKDSFFILKLSARAQARVTQDVLPA